jgi:hypothetical protein
VSGATKVGNRRSARVADLPRLSPATSYTTDIIIWYGDLNCGDTARTACTVCQQAPPHLAAAYGFGKTNRALRLTTLATLAKGRG